MRRMATRRRRRGGLVGLSAGALALALTLGEPRTIRRAPVPPVAAPAVQPDSGGWALRAGGWFIRVDGAEVELPSLAELTQPPVQIRGPQPLSPYDHLIAYHAEQQGLDWRLVAALIFEESRFDPEAVSDKGAYGLMQVRPIAAAAVGAREFSAPSDNIRTGARYLRQLSDLFADSPGRDRLALVLAAYNMGPAHMHDAQGLARRFGYSPTIWYESMELVLPLLEQERLSQHLPHGYANGSLTAAYVNRILDRYDAYRRQFGSQPFDPGDEPEEDRTESSPSG